MFKRTFLFSLLLFGVLSIFLVFFIVKVKSKDVEELEKLTTLSSKKKTAHFYSESYRQDVVKEIFLKEKNQQQVRIFCKNSALFFFHEGKRGEVIEHMGDVVCLLQEKLFFENGKPCQEVRYLNAKKACYNYATQLFFGEDVTICQFHLPGHILPKTIGEALPRMQGRADSVQFCLKDEKIDFKAQHFTASIDAL